jgi:hypothetical protein
MNNYKFLNRVVSEWFGVSGTAMYLHKYLGVYDSNPDDADNVLAIQDVLLQENRDRNYDPCVYELRCIYNVGDNDLDLKPFGAFVTDSILVYVHLNDMFEMVGRRIMVGDVIELPHMRDDMLLDPAAPAINKFYVVQDAQKASEGFQQNWWPLVWRLKCTPMPGTQEYADILNQQSTNVFGQDVGTLADILTNTAAVMDINDDVVALAIADVKKRYFETQQYWVMPGSETTGQNPWIFAGDGIPPDGAQVLGSGTSFPQNPSEGDYFLRTDYEPRALFRFQSSKWYIQEQDYRQSTWSPASRLLLSFINNDNVTTLEDGSTTPEKGSLHTAIAPRADF